MTPETAQYIFLAALAAASCLLIWKYFVPPHDSYMPGYLTGYDDGYIAGFDDGYIAGGDEEAARWNTLHDENNTLYDRINELKGEIQELREGYDFWRETAEEFGRQLQLSQADVDTYKEFLG
jgi:hypothetical protein